mmetsp:Transcript_20076/g.46945  ORF Transcript_20076/g.46945 Transcript_20076/m.46945 type:complete len:85 (+) Transcript_20076:232-486(+)
MRDVFSLNTSMRCDAMRCDLSLLEISVVFVVRDKSQSEPIQLQRTMICTLLGFEISSVLGEGRERRNWVTARVGCHKNKKILRS